MKNPRFLPLLLTVFLLTGCAPQSTAGGGSSSVTTQETGGNGKAVSVSAPGGDGYTSTIDGSVSFEKDEECTTSVDYPADGTEKKLTLTDGAGLTWGLAIPDGALLTPQTITMTAMKNIRSGLGNINGGVVFEPDGLRFIVPATLTVKGNGFEKSGMIFSGDGEGKNLELSVMDRVDGAVSMTVFHFSTDYGTDDPKTMTDLSNKAAGQRAEAEAAARELLKKPLEIVEPPVILIKCHHQTEGRDQKLLDEYIKDFGKPEMDVLTALMSAEKNKQLTSMSDKDMEWDTTLELQVAGRLIKKADELIKRYNMKDENMFVAVEAAAYFAENQYGILAAGVKGAEREYEQSLMPQLVPWAQQIAEKYLTGLEKDHEYKNIHPVYKMARYMGFLGVGDNATAKLLERLKKALTFKIETVNKLSIGISEQIKYTVKAFATVSFPAESNGAAESEGTGTYSPLELPDLGELIVTMDKENATFPLKLGISGFDPCNSATFDITVDRFGAENETLTGTVPGVSSSSRSRPVVQGASEIAFKDYKRPSENEQATGYKFTLELKDGQETAGEQTFTETWKGASVEYTVKFIHTP